MNREQLKRIMFVQAAVGALLLAAWPAAGQNLQTLPEQKTATVFGRSIRYYEAGTGPTVIFLHGLGADSSSWAANLRPTAGKFHNLALDQIGFGESDKPFLEYKIETFVEFLAAFMDELNIPKATLVGNSLGGWIAADFAARFPDRVDRLVLVDAAGLAPAGPPRTGPVDLNVTSISSARRILGLVFYNRQMITDDAVRTVFEKHLRNNDGYTIQRVLANAFAFPQFEDAKVGSIKARTLVVWGREDALIPLESGERYAKAIPGAKLVVFDECGHVPQLEKADEFNKALLEFLSAP
jgi:pimeloyl-ACP methyl ester carboxylesterase